MFVFGHIGIGRAIATPFRRGLPAVPFIIGTLLPDLIDKPLYYARVWDYVSCTRTFGHSGVLLAAILAAAWLFRSRPLAALGLGVATHLFLDGLPSLLHHDADDASWIAFTWPFVQAQFSTRAFPSIASHVESLWSSWIVTSEAIGLLLIGMDLRRRRRN
jgi:hypothetical protein